MLSPERIRAQSAISHVEMATARLREEKVAETFRADPALYLKLALALGQAQATLSWLEPRQ